MSEVALYSVGEAAEILGIGREGVHAMIRRGKLEAQRIGHRYLIDAQELNRAKVLRRPRSRPLSSRHAWAALSMLSRDDAFEQNATRGLSASARSRLRARIAATTMPTLAPLLHARAALSRLRADEGDINRIAQEPGVVRTGESAAEHHKFDITESHMLDAYVTRERAVGLEKKYLLQPSSRANIILRVVEGIWPFESGCTEAPRLVAALDLSESDDPRARRAGEEILQRWDELS